MGDFRQYLVRPGSNVSLGDIPSDSDGGLSEEQGKRRFDELKDRMEKLHEVLYAQQKHALLVVLQAMDTGGKDSTIRSVFTGFNPAGCTVVSFKAPSDEELHHDFLWRVHQHTPRRGEVAIFNRSHYEDVVIVRVKNLVPHEVWRQRYEHINNFEKMLSDEGTRVIKFYLHISKEYQKKRLQKRLDNPDKHWKFNPADLTERARWEQYMTAYEAALGKCSTDHAPWYIIPAQTRWYRNLIVAEILVETMESMDLQYPKPTFDPASIAID